MCVDTDFLVRMNVTIWDIFGMVRWNFVLQQKKQHKPSI